MGCAGRDPERRISGYGFWWGDSLLTAEKLPARVRYLKAKIEAQQTELASLENQYLALKARLAEAELPEKMAK
jgi:hypothetical protein